MLKEERKKSWNEHQTLWSERAQKHENLETWHKHVLFMPFLVCLPFPLFLFILRPFSLPYFFFTSSHVWYLLVFWSFPLCSTVLFIYFPLVNLLVGFLPFQNMLRLNYSEIEQYDITLHNDVYVLFWLLYSNCPFFFSGFLFPCSFLIWN